MSDSDPITRLNASLEGRYRIESELGEGGMATVYLADDIKHERKVALKVLKPELAAVVGAERFLAEIKTTANLQHPHILPLFDSGEADSYLFYVMPWVEGESLREKLDREHQLPVDDAVRIATYLAEALDYAHRHGVIHRDIKPGNVLIHDGQPVISDFGIALAVGTAGQGRLTETGLSMGTPHYMSPEQATGDMSVGAPTDTYALGCVLYEMLVGEPPYTGSTAQAILGKIIAGELASATKHRSSVPANVDAAIRKALEKVPADRFTGAQDFARALADPGFRHGEPAVVGIQAGSGVWKRLSVAMTAVAVVASAVAGWALLRPVPRPLARFDVPLGLVREVPLFGGVELALSPDGSRLVYVGEAPDGGTQLWQRAMDDLEPDPVPGTEGGRTPVLSPDGMSVAFGAAGAIKTVSLRGGPPLTVASQGIRPSWGSGGMVYFTRDDVIYRVLATGGEPEVVTSSSGGLHRFPDALPDGRGLLLTVYRGSAAPSQIAVVGPEGGEVAELFQGAMARYAASGHVVYATADGTLMAAPFDLKSLEVTGPAVGLDEGVEVHESSAAQFALSQTGTLLYRSGGAAGDEAEFVWVTRSGLAEPVSPGWSFDPGNVGWRLSPDDGRLVFQNQVEGNRDIWVKVLPDGAEARLTFSESVEGMPRWARNGQVVTFRSERSETGVTHLWSKRADGTGEAEVVFDGFDIAMGFWSPDGEWLVLRRSGGPGNIGARDILAMRPGVDSVALPLIADERFMEEGPAISPDGRWLAYSSNETGRAEVFVRPFPDVEGGKWQVSTNGGIRPLWAHSGRELFFVDATGSMVAAEIETDSGFRPGGLETLFTLPEGTLSGSNSDFYDITLDDQRFVMARAYGATEGPSMQLILIQNFFEELKRLVPTN